jgi:hypothetical protein
MKSLLAIGKPTTLKRIRSFFLEFYNGWVPDPALAFSLSIESNEKAMAMDDTIAWLHVQSAWKLLYRGERDKAFAAAEICRTFTALTMAVLAARSG